MKELTVVIPIQIDRRATPNGRGHWAAKKRVTDEMKNATHLAMIQAINLNDPDDCFQTARWPLKLDYEIAHGKGRRRLDDDNAIAAMKPIRDQIATCLGMDDRNFRTGEMVQSRDPDKLGKVIVTIRESEDVA